MSDLFGSTLGFTPAFTGQQLAIQAGGGMAQAFTGGMNAGTSNKSQGLNQEQFSFEKQKYNDMIARLDAMKRYLDGDSSGTSSYGSRRSSSGSSALP